MQLSYTEENYIKYIYHLSQPGKNVATNAIAASMQTKASTVTDMLNRLEQKKVLLYEKYKGVALTHNGKRKAIEIIRKHRLWEVFLVEKLQFTWDKVHAIAEQLEHINSNELMDKLDKFLDYPKFDPHGDPIPDKHGNITQTPGGMLLDAVKPNQTYTVIGVLDEEESFLHYLSQIGIGLHASFLIKAKFPFNNAIQLECTTTKKTIVVDKTAQTKILVRKKKQ